MNVDLGMGMDIRGLSDSVARCRTAMKIHRKSPTKGASIASHPVGGPIKFRLIKVSSRDFAISGNSKQANPAGR